MKCYTPEHEAGHALLAFLVGRTIESVTVSGCDGLTTSRPCRVETIWERCAVRLAGAVAEVVIDGRGSPPFFPADDSRNLDADIRQYLSINPGADGARIYARSLSEASRVLCAHRFALRGIAAHLRQFGRATHADIQRIINQ